MSAPPAAAPRLDGAAARRAAEDHQDHASHGGNNSSSRSGPRSAPRGRGTGSNSRRHGSREQTSASGSPGAAVLPGSSPHQHSSSPADRSNAMRNRRYGKWPAAGSSPAGSGLASSSRQSSSKGYTFKWPAYMDRDQLGHAMKRGHVFR
jgi:hypothetical protein